MIEKIMNKASMNLVHSNCCPRGRKVRENGANRQTNRRERERKKESYFNV